MSVYVSGEKAIVHSYFIPVVLDDPQNKNKRYIIADGKWEEVPTNITYKSIIWFQKPYKGGKNEAFKNNFEVEVEGSKGKTYTVKGGDDGWSCSCPAFGWSGGRGCKHIDKVKAEKNDI